MQPEIRLTKEIRDVVKIILDASRLAKKRQIITLKLVK